MAAGLRILVTGSRSWGHESTVTKALFNYWRSSGAPADAVLVHGGAPGVDSIAAAFWTIVLHLETECYQADWERLGGAAGPVRNQAMVNSGADICLGFPVAHPLGRRSGTVDCMDRAAKAHIPVVNLGTDTWTAP